MRIDTPAEDSAWLKAIDWHMALAYKPVLAIFRNDDGDLEIMSIFGDQEQEMLALFADNEAEPLLPEPEQ
jgi:hypothetical protein